MILIHDRVSELESDTAAMALLLVKVAVKVAKSENISISGLIIGCIKKDIVFDMFLKYHDIIVPDMYLFHIWYVHWLSVLDLIIDKYCSTTSYPKLHAL